MSSSSAVPGPQPFNEPDNNKALRLWFLDWVGKAIPYPHNASTWREPIESGFSKDLKGTWNNIDHNKETFTKFIAGSVDLFTAAWSDYIFTPEVSVATAFDKEGHSGVVIAAGTVSGHAKDGGQHYQGKLAIFAHIKWLEEEQRRVVTEFREVNNPANYPHHPWS